MPWSFPTAAELFQAGGGFSFRIEEFGSRPPNSVMHLRITDPYNNDSFDNQFGEDHTVMRESSRMAGNLGLSTYRAHTYETDAGEARFTTVTFGMFMRDDRPPPLILYRHENTHFMHKALAGTIANRRARSRHVKFGSAEADRLLSQLHRVNNRVADMYDHGSIKTVSALSDPGEAWLLIRRVWKSEGRAMAAEERAEKRAHRQAEQAAERAQRQVDRTQRQVDRVLQRADRIQRRAMRHAE